MVRLSFALFFSFGVNSLHFFGSLIFFKFSHSILIIPTTRAMECMCSVSSSKGA